MTKKENDFWKSAQAKEMAVKYFPSFFGKDLNVTTRYDVKKLESEYLKYCVKYFTIYENNSDRERFYIQMAYEYIKKILTEHTKFEVNSKLVNNILQSYNQLVSTVSAYSFTARYPTSYGDSQNDTNKKILLQISLFQPVLISVLKNIDNYFETISEPEKIDGFYCELISKLEELKKLLDNSNEKLSNAQDEYHETWDATNRSNYYMMFERGLRSHTRTQSQLGEAKKEWRLNRNKACHSILNFFKELENINIALYYGTFEFDKQNYGVDNDTLEVSELYNNGVRNIVNSPNYFCYLNETEKQEVAIQKILRKIQSKNNL